MLYLTILIEEHVRGPNNPKFFKLKFGQRQVNNFDQFGQHSIKFVNIGHCQQTLSTNGQHFVNLIDNGQYLVNLIDNLVNIW